jgi:hypothetical protein
LRLLAASALNGAAGTAYDLAAMRFDGFRSDPESLRLRRAYEWVNRHTPPGVVVAHNPDIGTEGYHALYGQRTAVVADIHHGRLFGVDPDRFAEAFDGVSRLFQTGVSPAEARRVCERWHIDVLVAKPTDPAWHDRGSWVWGPTAFANDAARVVLLRDLGSDH